ncbi:MAG: hypothetical protein M8353_00090 [ANME-2 cluster archaeon]|nr:hypothetical protein [ANME-2 cluster archaeon]
MDAQYQEQNNIDVTIDIEEKRSDGPEYILNVALTNRLPEPLTTFHYSLPWVGWDSILLIAVETDAIGTIIDKNLMIDDPGPARTTIQPGGSLSGNIPLSGRFPNLNEALKEHDVILFWSYQFLPIDAHPLKRVGGYLLIPQSSKQDM